MLSISTAPPATLNRATGDAVPIPTNPLASIVNAVADDVAKVDGDEVATNKFPFTERNVHAFCVSEPSESASCGAVDEAMLSAKRGVVVPIPTTGFVTPFT